MLNNWFVANKLSLNIDKNCYSVFGASASDRSAVKPGIADVELKQVESTKYLSIMIDYELNWSTHIDLRLLYLWHFVSYYCSFHTLVILILVVFCWPSEYCLSCLSVCLSVLWAMLPEINVHYIRQVNGVNGEIYCDAFFLLSVCL